MLATSGELKIVWACVIDVLLPVVNRILEGELCLVVGGMAEHRCPDGVAECPDVLGGRF